MIHGARVATVLLALLLGRSIAAQAAAPSRGVPLQWEWYDLRIIDIPQAGVFYDFREPNTLLFRLSVPMSFPVLLITPVHLTYATAYWGIQGLLGDITLGLDLPEASLADALLVRFVPISFWGGLPLSAKGMGVYLLGEVAPLSLFKSSFDQYERLYCGIGLNAGVKYCWSKRLEFELRYEYYLPYTGEEVDTSYIGLAVKYRIFELADHGIW
jgi:hypothetical protein